MAGDRSVPTGLGRFSRAGDASIARRAASWLWDERDCSSYCVMESSSGFPGWARASVLHILTRESGPVPSVYPSTVLLPCSNGEERLSVWKIVGAEAFEIVSDVLELVIRGK